ncbi:unnamed protein product [Closterium sp. Naga37s-1]|nr:unnamed protein product [Closterium sp. Naga37s-1]
MPFRLPIAKGAAPAAPSAAPVSLATAPEAAACMMNYYDNSDDDMAGFGGSPMRRGANGAADNADDWMPRNRGRKDWQMAGGRIKARSMAERQRRERISEGLQKLRLVPRAYPSCLPIPPSPPSLRADDCARAYDRDKECEENVGSHNHRSLSTCASASPSLARWRSVEECEENVGKLRKLRFEARNMHMLSSAFPLPGGGVWRCVRRMWGSCDSRRETCTCCHLRSPCQVEECDKNVGKLRKLRFEAESTSMLSSAFEFLKEPFCNLMCLSPSRNPQVEECEENVEECEENVGKLRKLRFEAENKFDATHAMGEKMKEKMAECEETTAKNAAERHKEKSELMAQVHELENKVKELQAKLGISEDSSTTDETSSDGSTSDK